VNDGKSAIYFWDDVPAPAACLVSRYHRLGWFLSETRGPKNAELEREPLARIEQAFVQAGIRPYAVVRPVLEIIEFVGEERLRRGRGRRVAPDEIPF
jgi:hypothetical protein